MMVKQQQRRIDRCFLPVGSNNVTLVRFPTQRQSQPPAREANHPVPVQENQDGETEAKRICFSGSEETLTNGEADAELHDPIESNTSSVEDQESPGHGAQQVAPESSEGNRAAELVSAGCLKVTIQRSSESREFGEKDPSSERFTCHICHCSCPSAQSFQLHMSGVDHQLRLQRITQSLAVTQHTGRRSGASERWCDVCQSHFTGDIILHRRTKEHKECKKCGRPFCPVCHRHFRTPRKFVEHMKSPEHKQQVQLEKSQEGEMITVDAVGCFETESKTQFASEPGDKEIVASDGAEEQSDSGDIGHTERLDEEAQLGEEEAQLGDEEAQLGEEEAQLGDEEAQLGEEEAQLGDEKAQLGEEEAQLGDEEAQLGDEKAQLGEEEAQLGDEEAQLGDEKAQLGDEEAQLGDEEAQLGDEMAQLGDEEAQLGDEMAQLGDEEAQLGEEVGIIDGDIGKVPAIGNIIEGIKSEQSESGDEIADTEEGLDADDTEKDTPQVSEIETAVTQEFNPHTVYGSAYVVPVSGFFCRLCHKFFFRETSARDQHCRSHQHFSRLLQRQRGPDQTQDSADPASCSTHSTK